MPAYLKIFKFRRGGQAPQGEQPTSGRRAQAKRILLFFYFFPSFIIIWFHKSKHIYVFYHLGKKACGFLYGSPTPSSHPSLPPGGEFAAASSPLGAEG